MAKCQIFYSYHNQIRLAQISSFLTNIILLLHMKIENYNIKFNNNSLEKKFFKVLVIIHMSLDESYTNYLSAVININGGYHHLRILS